MGVWRPLPEPSPPALGRRDGRSPLQLCGTPAASTALSVQHLGPCIALLIPAPSSLVRVLEKGQSEIPPACWL